LLRARAACQQSCPSRGNKRPGFASVHTFLLVNGFDLDVSSKSAFDFMIETMTAGKFRFAVIHEWISALIVLLPR
jgi:prophage maintenance system killer protein